ncbi:hypothetical protein [Brachybacterium hainanense]|uniref:Uncharacterized protein n=1 Tax=Brachybacterium hainanense TaxID=1541174 RepID=A0ABV6RC13_9MICO
MFKNATIEEIIEQGPFDSKKFEKEFDARIDAKDALRRWHEPAEIEKMDFDQISEAAMIWAGSVFVVADLEKIPWSVLDGRFIHASRVVDFEIVEAEYEEPDHDRRLWVNVELRETESGFQKRVDAERAARSAE